MGGHWRGWGERRAGGGGGRPPAPRQPPPPPNPSRYPTCPPPLKERRFSFESRSKSDDTVILRGKNLKPPVPTPTARPTKAVAASNPPPPKIATAHPPPPPTKTGIPKGGGATAEKKDDRSGDLIVGTVAHVPYPTRVEKGTVRGVHGRKYGAFWLEYPGGTTLYEVCRHLLFPTPEEAKQYQEEARSGQEKAPTPRPHKRRD